MKEKLIYIIFFFMLTNQVASEEDIMIMKLKDGDVKIELFNDIAPNHVKRFKKLAEEKIIRKDRQKTFIK